MILLTKKQQKSYEGQKISYICKKEFIDNNTMMKNIVVRNYL